MDNKKTEKLVQLVSYGALESEKKPRYRVPNSNVGNDEGHGKALRPLGFVRRSLMEDSENCLSVL